MAESDPNDLVDNQVILRHEFLPYRDMKDAKKHV